LAATGDHHYCLFTKMTVMANSTYLIFTAGLLIFSVIYLVAGKFVYKFFKIKSDPITYESSKEALNRIASWTTWLTGLQTGAIAVMGLLFKPPSTNHLKIYGFFAILFFGASIILATWLLSSLPSIQQRLVDSKEPSEKNDIYTMKIFSFIPFRLGRFSGLVHTYFLIGIVFYALFIFEIFK
jgi:hypothetical protein